MKRENISTDDKTAKRISWGYAIALVFNVGLVLWGVNKGVSFSDESLYFYLIEDVDRLSYFLSSFYQVYVHFFGWAGLDIVSVRLVTLTLYVVTPAAFAYGAWIWYRGVSNRRVSFPFLYVWIALFMFFIYSHDMMTVGYNTLALFFLLVQTGLLLLALRRFDEQSSLAVNALIAAVMGAASAAILYCRIPTGVLLAMSIPVILVAYPSAQSLVKRLVTAGASVIGFALFLLYADSSIQPISFYISKIFANREAFSEAGQTSEFYIERIHSFLTIVLSMAAFALVARIYRILYDRYGETTEKTRAAIYRAILFAAFLFVFVVGVVFIYRSMAFRAQAFFMFSLIATAVFFVTEPGEKHSLRFKLPQLVGGVRENASKLYVVIAYLCVLPFFSSAGTGNALIINMLYVLPIFGLVIYLLFQSVEDTNVFFHKKIWMYFYLAFFTVGFAYWYVELPYGSPHPLYTANYTLAKSENGAMVKLPKVEKDFLDSLRLDIESLGYKGGDKLLGIDVSPGVLYLLDAESEGGLWYNLRKAALNFRMIDEAKDASRANIAIFNDDLENYDPAIIERLAEYGYNIAEDFRLAKERRNPIQNKTTRIYVRKDAASPSLD
ncbi:MAG: hypothetical protein GF419_02100 [Ignavibacteriales bacterium]|nr:hypothetical protein [Ignavibacteriales bacterium]